MESINLTEKICELILSKKGHNIKILDLKEISSVADSFIICSADSTTQVKAIADEVNKTLRNEGIKCVHKEGYDSLNWVLLDYFEVVVHIFRKEIREFYNLEKLWGDAPTKEINDIP